MKDLLILDLNHLLWDRRKTHIPWIQDFTVHRFRRDTFVIRPDIGRFLTQVFERFHVGFFSSSQREPSFTVLRRLLGTRKSREALFFWFSEQTTRRFQKDLQKVREEFSHVKFGKILIVDDSLEKIIGNSEGEILCIKGWYFDKPTEETLEDVLSAILKRFPEEERIEMPKKVALTDEQIEGFAARLKNPECEVRKDFLETLANMKKWVADERKQIRNFCGRLDAYDAFDWLFGEELKHPEWKSFEGKYETERTRMKKMILEKRKEIEESGGKEEEVSSSPERE